MPGSSTFRKPGLSPALLSLQKAHVLIARLENRMATLQREVQDLCHELTTLRAETKRPDADSISSSKSISVPGQTLGTQEPQRQEKQGLEGSRRAERAPDRERIFVGDQNVQSRIVDLRIVPQLMKRQNTNLAIVSYGGSCSNALANALRACRWRVHTKIWDQIVCHCPQYLDFGVPVIYVFEDPVRAFLSQNRRELLLMNQHKLTNSTTEDLDPETMFRSMFQQFRDFVRHGKDKVFFLRSSQLFLPETRPALEAFLKCRPLRTLPLQFRAPKTETDKVPSRFEALFAKFRNEIDFVRNFDLTTLPFHVPET